MSSFANLVASDEDENILTNEEIISLISKLKEKCKHCNLKISDASKIEDGNIDIDITIEIPDGRSFRELWIGDSNYLEEVNNTSFEKFKFINNYQAIWSEEHCSIEAFIYGTNSRGAPFSPLRMLRSLDMSNNNEKGFLEYELTTPEGFQSDLIIKIKRASPEIAALCDVQTERSPILEIKNINVDTHDKSLEILNKISNSIFFEMDINKNISFHLLRSNRPLRRRTSNNSDIPIMFPKNTYDNEPMTLYWYARRALNMPLLQYLAYYQAIEFYYPIFHNADLSRKIKSILRSPSFRYEKDTDIVKLINALKGKSNGVASEREQLKATLKECINPEDLKIFIDSNDERKVVLTKKLSNITSHAIQVNQGDEGLIANLVERIYSIRCKIVHIKADDKVDDLKLLLPFSKEEDSIQHDIDLIQYVAQKIIVHCSKSFDSL